MSPRPVRFLEFLSPFFLPWTILPVLGFMTPLKWDEVGSQVVSFGKPLPLKAFKYGGFSVFKWEVGTKVTEKGGVKMVFLGDRSGLLRDLSHLSHFISF